MSKNTKYLKTVSAISLLLVLVAVSFQSHAATTNVKVLNGQRKPVPTFQAPRERYQTTVNMEVAPGQQGATIGIPVPAGKILVIEFLSAFFNSPHTSQVINFTLRTQNNGNLAYHDFVLHDHGFVANPLPRWQTVSQQTKIFSDGDIEAVMGGGGGGAGSGGIGRVTVSGYLVNNLY